MSATVMKKAKAITRIATVLFAVLGVSALSAQAETVLSVTQTSYDVRNQPICTTVRMNPAIYGSLPSDPCTLGTAGSYGPDRITKNTYDTASQLTRVDQAFGTSVARIYARYTYSNNGLKTSEKDANSNLTTLEYDGFDRLSKLRYPNTTSGIGTSSTTDYEQFAYDNNGNKTWWRKRDGRYIYYNYDNLSREILNYPSDSSRPNIYTGYDLTGKITYKRFTSTSGSGVTYYYDGLGRMSATTDMNGRSIWLGYNQASVREPTVYPDGIASWHGRDALNRLVGISYNGSTYVTQAYDELGRRAAIGKGSGNTYYAHDAIGRLYAMTNDLSGTAYDISWEFAYNPASQIVTLVASSNVYDYKETVNTTVNKTFDGLNRDATIAALSGGFDARGNLTYDGARTFTYDVENRLLTATGGGANVRLDYDPEGRLAKYSTDGGSTYSTYLYDGVNLIAEYNNAGTMLRRYIHGTGTDEPLIWFEGSGTSDLRYLYQNYQGSVIGYTNASADIQQIYKYGPYGEPRDAANAENWSGPRFRYTGQTIIPEAKLYYYKARVYDPVFGRFLQTDPIGSKDDLDLYAYVGGDPINNVDPDGECKIGRSVDDGKPCGEGTAAYVGQTTGRSGQVRQNYSNGVKNLNSTDRAGRSALKESARSQTPAFFRKLVEAFRPGTGPKSGSVDGAARTNAGWDKFGKGTKALGRASTAVAVVVGAAEIATSDNKARTASQVGGELAGGIAGGIAGAETGAAAGLLCGPGAPACSTVGALVGGIAGAYYGSQAGRAAGGAAYDGISQ